MRKRIVVGKRFVCAMLFACVGILSASAGEPLKISFRSRALLDAAVSGYGKEDVQGYYRLEDFRVGFKAVYGRYEMKADIGLMGSKASIKDMLLNYYFDHSVLSLGNAYDPYSMDMLISTVDMRFHQSAGSSIAFTDGRKVGVTYHYYVPSWYLATGVYTRNDINKIGGEEQKNSFVSTTRAVWRYGKEDWLFHVGGAFSFHTAQSNTETPPEVSIANSGVTSLFGIPLMEATVDHAGTELKGVFEALYIRTRFMVQGEYFLNRFNRTQGRAYRPQGGYLQAGFLLKGQGFEYDSMYAVPGRPKSEKAIELTARFNYTDLNDSEAGIMGGSESDLSLGINFYLNKYLAVKLNGSYVFTGSHCNEFYSKNLPLGQLRVQYAF